MRLAIAIRWSSGFLPKETGNPVQRKLTASGGLQIGLANLAKRYNLLFKEEIEVREENNTFIVTIPLI